MKVASWVTIVFCVDHQASQRLLAFFEVWDHPIHPTPTEPPMSWDGTPVALKRMITVWWFGTT